MSKIIAGMTMSLDGFISDKDGQIGKLYSDFKEMKDAPLFKEIIGNTGAVIMGRTAFNMSGTDPDAWLDYEFQTPIFVLTHTPPSPIPNENEKIKFTFVQDGIESAVTQAKQAAGNKDVQIIGGVSTIQQCLNAKLCDELSIDIVSLLLGEGKRLLENIDSTKINLVRISVEQTTSFRTSFIFKVTYNTN